MNVLIFVMTMLMLLAMLTYGRLATYTSSQVSQVMFEKYMRCEERAFINSAAKPIYDGIHKTAKKEDVKKEDKTSPSPKVAANSEITIAPLFATINTPEAAKKQEQAKVMVKALMRALYADAPFFKEMAEKRPTFMDDLIQSLIDASNQLSVKEKWKKSTELANISLPDKDLDQVLYLMLKGTEYKNLLPTSDIGGREEVKKEGGIPNEENFCSKKRHFSLKDFINFSNTQKIRLYLAPREVLEVVFEDKKIVEEVILERNNLYRKAINGADVKELSKIFEAQFDSKRSRDIHAESVDYSISKTNPNN